MQLFVGIIKLRRKLQDIMNYFNVKTLSGTLFKYLFTEIILK